MFTPSGHPAEEIDQAMLLNIWAHHLDQKKSPRMLYAGIGKPGYSVDKDFVLSSISYWMQHLLNLPRLKAKDSCFITPS